MDATVGVCVGQVYKLEVVATERQKWRLLKELRRSEARTPDIAAACPPSREHLSL